MRKTYKILLVIFFILILKCITPEDVQADTFALLDTSYNPITEISLKKGEDKTVVIGIKSSRDNAKISKVTLPNCIKEWYQEGGSGNVWHVATNKDRTNYYDLIMEIHIKGGETEGDAVTASGTLTIDVQSLKTETYWCWGCDKKPHIDYAPTWHTYEATYETSSLQLTVNVTDPVKESQANELKKLEEYRTKLVEELNKGPDGIPSMISAAGSDYYKLALLFQALADERISYNLEDLKDGMIHHVRR